jgi:hypothetical protein
MLPTPNPSDAPAPAAPDGGVIELRQYTLHPGRRDALIALFDREFIEPQEAEGIRVLGQFRDLDDDDRFVWLRGFADMAARGRALAAFYGGPVWAMHREAANATMVDSDDVLLLRPAWAGAGLPEPSADRAGRDATASPHGVWRASVFHLRAPADAALLALCRGALSEALRADGARVLAWYVTEGAPNNFPRLPVREGEPVLVALARFDGDADPGDLSPHLDRWLALPTQHLRLAPTARSAHHA